MPAVVVHRNEWLSGKVAGVLSAAVVQVVATLDDGSDAIGATVAEHPDLLLLVEDTLPRVPASSVTPGGGEAGGMRH